MGLSYKNGRESMKVALVRLNHDLFNRLHADEHLGIGYLTSCLREKRISVEIFDTTVASESSIHTSLVDYCPDFIGYTVDVENIRTVIDFDHKLNLHIQPTRCWGGHHASLCAEDILKDECCDIVVIGDGENTLPHLVQSVAVGMSLYQVSGIAFRDGDRIAFTKNGTYQKQLYTLPWPSRDILACMASSSPITTARILSSRGCPYDCIYCTTPAMNRLANVAKYCARPPIDFVDEIEYLYKNFGVKQYYINDDLYFYNSERSKQRALSVANEILKRGLNIAYKVEIRADSFDPICDIDLLQTLRTSGLKTIFIGLESGSDKMLYQLKKKITVNQNRAAVEALRKAGIRVNIGRILFGPDSTWSELEESVKVLHELGCCQQVFRHPGFKLRVFPGTNLERKLEQEGRLVYKEKRYFEPEYVFSNKKVEAFCDALTNMYEDLWPLVKHVFDSRSFEDLDPSMGEILENLSFELLYANIRLGDSWSSDVFNRTKDLFFSKIKKAVGYNREAHRHDEEYAMEKFKDCRYAERI